MGKLIFFLIIIAIIYFIFIKKPSQIKPTNTSSEDNENNDLIMCDKCKTFTPQNEIFKINGKNICKECYDNFK